jgi:hypothetical protein
MIFVYALLFFFGLIFLFVFGLKKIKKNITIPEIIVGNLYLFSLVLLFIGLLIHNNQYSAAIDPVDDECYTPFGEKHIVTLVFYFVMFNVSVLLIWLKGSKLPPLTKVLSLSFLVIGMVIAFFVLLQLSRHDTKSMDFYERTDHLYFLIPAPVISLLVSAILLVYMIKSNMMTANEKTYSNKFLNRLNTFLVQKNNLPVWGIVLIVPLLLLVTIVLILFGQDPNSLIKVFTETTTWRFSQQMHPPVLDHKGHYLCTVAASGDPKIVKPLRLGKRHGNTIIVNRQLLVANAFEEMVQNFSPGLHRLIRSNYDRYGYNLSLKINNEQMSNLTYILMKPLEWMFLICLYLCCEKPEEMINKQYQL